MTHHSTPLAPPQPICCTTKQAWAWVNAVAEMAVNGDDDARRALPETVDHYLAACRGVLR